MLLNKCRRLPMLDKERAYYENNLSTLQGSYLGKYVVISGENIIGDYESDEEAYAGAINANCTPGFFMIKLITEDPEEQTQHFTSLVYV
jgi:hypothetical protein